MSDIANVVKEEKKKDFPVTWVTGIRRTKGKETTIRKLPKDTFYCIRIPITETYGVIYNNVEQKEMCGRIQEFIGREISHHKKYYVVPTRRKK